MSGVRRALVLAVDSYDDPSLARLIAPQTDADHLAQVLGDADIGGFEVSVVRNGPSYEVARRIDDFLSDRQRDDLLLLHFSGHGLKSDSGELYLAGTDTRPDRLRSTGVPADLVARLMNNSRAGRVALFLDCCYGGAFERGLVARAGTGVEVGEMFRQSAHGDRGRVVITASSATEYAFEGAQLASDEVSPSVFTRALTQGLSTGAADLDQDGQITVDELYDYVYGEVKRTSPQQTPGKWVFGLHGEIDLASNLFRKVRPAELPEELLRQAMEPIAGIRVGVVQELAGLLGHATPEVRLAAYLELSRMLEDDSRKVTSAAQAVLAGARTVADPPRVELGAPGDGVEVALRGPLAEALTVESAPAGLQVRKIGATVRLRRTTDPPAAAEVHVRLAAADVAVPVAVRLPAVAEPSRQAAAAPGGPAAGAGAPPPAAAAPAATPELDLPAAAGSHPPAAPESHLPVTPPAPRRPAEAAGPLPAPSPVVDTGAGPVPARGRPAAPLPPQRRTLAVLWAAAAAAVTAVPAIVAGESGLVMPWLHVVAAAILLAVGGLAVLATGAATGLPSVAGGLLLLGSLEPLLFGDSSDPTAAVAPAVLGAGVLAADLLTARLLDPGPSVSAGPGLRIAVAAIVALAAVVVFRNAEERTSALLLAAGLAALAALLTVRPTQPVSRWPFVTAGVGTAMMTVGLARLSTSDGDWFYWRHTSIGFAGLLALVAAFLLVVGGRLAPAAAEKAVDPPAP